MTNIKNKKILLQIIEILKQSPLTLIESLVLSLQLLCLPKLSKKSLLPEDVNLEDLSNLGVLKNTWELLAEDHGKIGTAYSDLNILSRIEPPVLKRAVDFCLKASSAGLLGDFDPTDCMTSISGKKTGEFAIPPELADFILKLADIKPEESVYTPWDNTGQLTSRAAKLGVYVYSEISTSSPLSELISLFMESGVDIIHTDPISEPCAVEGGYLKKFDVTVAFLPFGVKYDPSVFQMDLYNRFFEQTKSGNVLALRHVISQTKGRAILVVPNVLLFSPGSALELRKDILSKGIVETIIALPSGLLQTTNIPISVIVLNLSKNRSSVRFINADTDQYRLMTSKARCRFINTGNILSQILINKSSGLACVADVNKILKMDSNLQANRYELSASAKKIGSVLDKSETVYLGEIATVIRPMAIKHSEDAITAFEIGVIDLPDHGYIKQPAKLIVIDKVVASKNKDKFILPYDIILIIKGSVGSVGIAPAVVPEPGENGWAVSQSAIILRVKNKNFIDPKVLAAYLRSNLGQQLIENMKVKSATVPTLQLRDLQKLKIIIPSKTELPEIIAAIDDQAEIQEEIEELKIRQASLTKNFWEKEA